MYRIRHKTCSDFVHEQWFTHLRGSNLICAVCWFLKFYLFIVSTATSQGFLHQAPRENPSFTLIMFLISVPNAGGIFPPGHFSVTHQYEAGY